MIIAPAAPRRDLHSGAPHVSWQTVRIAYYNLTTTTKHGGVESFVWEAARYAAATGHSPTIFGGTGAQLRAAPGVAIRQFPYIARETWGRARPLRASLNLLKLLERASFAARALPALANGKFDLIQISKPYDLPWSAHARQWSGARVVYNAQGTDFWPGDALFRKTVDAAFSCSTYNAQMVARRYMWPLDVSYNGFDATTFQPRTPDTTLRARYAAPGSFVLLYVGRLVTFKGLDYLLDALALTAPRLRVAPTLLLAGDGPHRSKLEARAARLGISDLVRFVGPQPNAELPAFHAISDAFVLPSTDHETFGIAACEAMGCARPVIAARTGGLPEVVRDGETGLLVPPADASALANAIVTLAEDAALRAQMGSNGRAWVTSMFTWEAVMQRVWRSYERALA